jgi:hypothetical protein
MSSISYEFLVISLQNLMKINSSLQTPRGVLNSVTVCHIYRQRLDALGITPLLRDFAQRSELRRRIFGKFEKNLLACTKSK